MIRQICTFPGCSNLGRNKGKVRGVTKYDRFCDRHHRLRTKSVWKRSSIDNSTCEMCGWNKSYCDRHRIDPNKGYYKENVIVLCPNCHRLAGN